MKCLRSYALLSPARFLQLTSSEIEKVLKCDTGSSTEIRHRESCAFPMIGDAESREDASPMQLTFPKEEVKQIAGSLMKEGKTGAEHLNSLAHGGSFVVLTEI